MVEVTICLLLKGNPPTHIPLGWKKTGLGNGKYTGIGGKIEAGETAQLAAVRELREEVGIEAKVTDLENVGQLTFQFPSRPEWDEIAHVFLLCKWEGEPIETDEINPIWMAIEDILYPDMWEDYQHWLPGVLQGEKADARFVYSADNETVESVEYSK